MYLKKENISAMTAANVFGGKGPIISADIWPEKYFPKNSGKFIRHVVIPPGSSLGKHTHTGEKELYYVLRGHITALDGEDAIELSPGDVLLTGWGEAHALYNNSAENFEMISVILFDDNEEVTK